MPAPFESIASSTALKQKTQQSQIETVVVATTVGVGWKKTVPLRVSNAGEQLGVVVKPFVKADVLLVSGMLEVESSTRALAGRVESPVVEDAVSSSFEAVAAGRLLVVGPPLVVEASVLEMVLTLLASSVAALVVDDVELAVVLIGFGKNVAVPAPLRVSAARVVEVSAVVLFIERDDGASDGLLTIIEDIMSGESGRDMGLSNTDELSRPADTELELI